ncbi:DegT/DnrJ/EryC1/StrS family aminotransferase [Paenibacillus nicotianae]|uniref:DegT/DnrJ/EryC1/StrS family aminotransferase n=1 Tax=Paenibacillus nicotianae TaxID=1526551 RepID=A0ABW4UU69_9BACL
MNKLAILGGKAAVPLSARKVEWPIVTNQDHEAVNRVLESGKFTSMSAGESEVSNLEKEWANFVGAQYCVAVSNGTTALHLALSALDLKPGDEVLVPALSFIATALAPLYHLLIPVFVDIDPITFNISLDDMQRKRSERTKAVIVVHLHGLPADMNEILIFSQKYNLKVVEDAAQAHGATYDSKNIGTIGDITTFSLNVSKNLPTCGEGGLITTNNYELYEKMLMNRQFGELVKEGEKREYIHQTMGWNYKLNSIQAAFTRSQLERFEEEQEIRNHNIIQFLKSISELPGVIVPQIYSDRTHVWHILRIRFDSQLAGLFELKNGQFREVIKKVLAAEGVPLSEYQKIPLQGHQVFQYKKGYGDEYPWKISNQTYDYQIEDTPNTLDVIENTLTLQKMHLNPNSDLLLKNYADAFYKLFEYLNIVESIGKNIEAFPPWTAFSQHEIKGVF